MVMVPCQIHCHMITYGGMMGKYDKKLTDNKNGIWEHELMMKFWQHGDYDERVNKTKGFWVWV